jgi:hypothetical protein
MLLPTFIEQVNWSDGDKGLYKHYWDEKTVKDLIDSWTPTMCGKTVAIFKIIPHVNISKLL